MRQVLQSAYVLHQRPYRDSSALVEIFSAEHGRIGLVAHGVRSRRSQRKALLQPFVPLLLSWSGKGELMTLTDVERDVCAFYPASSFQGMALMSAFYVNELILRLLRRQDPHSELFGFYHQLIVALANLSAGEDGVSDALQVILRLFEKRLLEQLGYGLSLTQDALGHAVLPAQLYRYELGEGAMLAEMGVTQSGRLIEGQWLLALAAEDLTVQAAKKLKYIMRLAIEQQLGNKPLHSRQILLDMQRKRK